MKLGVRPRRLFVTVLFTLPFTAGCAFQGLNSLPLPGVVGRESDAVLYHVQIANIGALEPNSPVMLDDVVVGSVGAMRFDDWHVSVDLSVKGDVTVPENAVARVGQTSLLGSMHLALDPPTGEAPTGRLSAGATMPMSSTFTFPSTEYTLSAVSAVVNGGSLGQFGDIIHSFNAALDGNQTEIRTFFSRLNDFIAVFDTQRDKMVETIKALSRLAGTLAAENDQIAEALDKIPSALDVLNRERPRLTTALDKLRVFSDTSVKVVNDTRDNLAKNLENLAPTMQALADVGPHLTTALAAATTFPQGQDTIDRGIKGDYMNLFAQVDLTIPRLKRTLFNGTRWGDNTVQLVPAPGEPFGVPYTTDPLSIPIAPVPSQAPPPSAPPEVPSIETGSLPGADRDPVIAGVPERQGGN